jgi:hypothetical protein
MPGFPQTTDELAESVEANTEVTFCPLTHLGTLDFHKEPYIAASPGQRANSGTTRAVLHTLMPDNTWRTTVEARWP